MLSTLKFRGEVIFSAAAFAVLFLSLALTGCGGDEGSEVSLGRQATEPRPSNEVALPPPLPIETPVAVTESVETQIDEPEPPREVTYEEAEAAFLDRRYDEAVELFTVYAERRHSNPWGFYMLGLSAWKSGQPENAEAAFEAALELDPQHTKSWLNLSRVLLDAQRSEEALEKIDAALTLEPESGVAFRLKGRAYHQLGRLEEAIEAYHQAILSDDRDVWSMNNLGLILIEQERFSEALRPLARAVELQGEVGIFHNNLGVAMERTGHYRAAEQAYRTAFEVDESHQKAQVSLARVEGLEQDPSLEPIDLEVLAESFVEEVKGWREAIAFQVDIDTPVGEATIDAVRSDSVNVQNEQTDESGPPNAARPQGEVDGPEGR